MGGAEHSLKELRQNLRETESIIDILERASQELTAIITWDDSVRSNPLRGRQLTSIGEQLAIARGRKTSLAREIEQIQTRSGGYAEKSADANGAFEPLFVRPIRGGLKASKARADISNEGAP